MIYRGYCDCPLYLILTHFCVYQKCDGFRRLCANCKQKHMHGSTDYKWVIQFEQNSSFNPFSCNQNNPQKQNILNQLNKVLNTAKQCFTILSQIKNQESRNSLSSQFEKSILRSLNLLLGTLDNKQQVEKRLSVLDKAADFEQLSDVSYQFRKLQQKHFKDDKWIKKMCSKLQENLLSLKKELKTQDLAVDKYRKMFVELNPLEAPPNL